MVGSTSGSENTQVHTHNRDRSLHHSFYFHLNPAFTEFRHLPPLCREGPYIRALLWSLGSLFCLSRLEQLRAIPSSQHFMRGELHFSTVKQ